MAHHRASNAVRVLFNKPVSESGKRAQTFARKAWIHCVVCDPSILSCALFMRRSGCVRSMRSCPIRKESTIDSVHANEVFQFTSALHSKRSSVRYRESYSKCKSFGVRFVNSVCLFRFTKKRKKKAKEPAKRDEKNLCEWDLQANQRRRILIIMMMMKKNK